MPANTLNIMAFEQFLFDCAKDPKFAAEFVVPEVARLLQAQGEDLDLLDRYVVYPVATSLMRERLMLTGRSLLVRCGRRQTGARAASTRSTRPRCCSTSRWTGSDPHERNAGADFPSIWLQGPQGHAAALGRQQHEVEERNKNAAFGTGTTPPTLDRPAIGRIEDWLLTMEPPKYPYPIDAAKAARGGVIYAGVLRRLPRRGRPRLQRRPCRQGDAATDIGTDPQRLDSYHLRPRGQSRTLYAGYPDAFHSARHSATRTCRSTASGCARRICTTVRCRRCAICSSPPPDARPSSTAATTSTTR